jgi:hypothetical protein
MARWGEFAAAAPELAEAGRRLLYPSRIGLGYLATVRKDGGPRVHPVCPVIVDGGLYALIGSSLKQADLVRDGRYALHSFAARDVDDEFYLTGRARRIEDQAVEARVRAAYSATGAQSSNDEALFEFDIERAMLATYKKRGSPDNWPPRYTKWRAPAR